jgi:hypothetical protein
VDPWRAKKTSTSLKFADAVPDGDGVYWGWAASCLFVSKDDPCIVVHERDAACSILSSLPDKAARGRYRIRVDFCRRPFGDMPERVVSNEVEITDVPKW